MTKFDIKSDLNGRPIPQQVEILYISGPTAGNIERIASILCLSLIEVKDIITEIEMKKARSRARKVKFK